MFSYQVMSENEAMQKRFNLLKDGEYDAIIVKSEDKTSSSGNPMMDMTLTVFDETGSSHQIRDFLVFTDTMMWKVIRCAESAGVMTEYEKQKFCSNLVIGKKVKVQVSVEEGSIIPEDKLKGKLPGSKYPDKNKIQDYLKEGGKRSEMDDDLIPF